MALNLKFGSDATRLLEDLIEVLGRPSGKVGRLVPVSRIAEHEIVDPWVPESNEVVKSPPVPPFEGIYEIRFRQIAISEVKRASRTGPPDM